MSSGRKTTMPYVPLGTSGLKISKIILGVMTYGPSEWQPWMQPEEVGMEHIKAAYDAGIQTFDTADVYSNGANERLLGRAIKEFNLPRHEIVVMTKVFAVVGRTPSEYYGPGGPNPNEHGYINQYGLSRKHIFEAVKHSLERLQLDYIDVLHCHRFDPTTPIAETMQALHDVVKAGHVRYIAMGTCAAWQFHVMQNYAITHNLTPFISLQNEYSLVYREEENEMFPTLKHFGVGTTPYSPLARGYVTKRIGETGFSGRSKTDPTWNMRYDSAANREIVSRVEQLSKKKGITMAQVAIAWLTSKPAVSAPIIGASTIQNLQELIAAVHLTLTDEEIKFLEEPYEPRPILG